MLGIQVQQNLPHYAYQCYYSCETALVRIHNDITSMLDSKLNVFLLLFDLSAAFDTVNHRILLSKLHDVYGLDGKVLAWLTSYVINHKYFVKIDQSVSCDVQALFGVPQGSILGPILFNLYFRDAEKLAKSHGLQFICMLMICSVILELRDSCKLLICSSAHLYADDMQCYFGAERQLSPNLIADKIRCFVHDLKSWMSNNFL